MSRHKYTKKELIALLKAWARKHGETPSQSQWDSDATMPSSCPVRYRFGSWSKGLKSAGLIPKEPMISKLSRESMIKAHTGKRSFAWKGGRIIDKKTGYVFVWNPTHPNAVMGNNKAYVLEHRMVMSNHLKRPLLRSEQVHHKNGDRADNKISNLELWTTSQPSGQRVKDKLKWAKEFINIYETPELLKENK